MKFEYKEIVTATEAIDIDDIGNCALLAQDTLGQEYYLITSTILGWTELINYGPCSPDLYKLPLGVTYTYNRFEYNEGKICKAIEKFLNPTKCEYVKVEMVDFDFIK